MTRALGTTTVTPAIAAIHLSSLVIQGHRRKGEARPTWFLVRAYDAPSTCTPVKASSAVCPSASHCPFTVAMGTTHAADAALFAASQDGGSAPAPVPTLSLTNALHSRSSSLAD